MAGTNELDKEFIPYKQALALKELGFDEPCFATYNTIPNAYSEDGDHKLQLNYCLYWDAERLIKEGYTHILRAPTYSQAFRWFREKYNLFHSITRYRQSNVNSKNSIFAKVYECCIIDENHDINTFVNDCDTHEDAELECLLKLIEIVKNK